MNQQEKERWINFATSFYSTTPFFHLVSKLTCALFLVMAVATSGYLDYLFDNYPKTTNIFIGAIAYYIASKFEGIAIKVEKGFSFVVVRFKESLANAALAAGALAVLIPILTISAVTSFSGIQGNINRGELGLDKAQSSLANINKSNKSNTSDLDKNLSQYKADRKELKEEMEQSFKNALDNAKIECKHAYETKAERTSCYESKSVDITEGFNKKLFEFDEETAKGQQAKQKLIDNAVIAAQSNSSKLSDIAYKQIDHKTNQVAWVAKIIGYSTVGFEIMALIASLMAFGVAYRFGADLDKEVMDYNKQQKGKGWFGFFRKS